LGKTENSRDPGRTSRRQFLRTSAVSAAALASAPYVHGGGNDTLRVGLIGCGGRGTGAATQALNADRNVRLVAMGDMFRDKLDSSLATLRRSEAIANKIDVPAERQFVGFDAYNGVLQSGVDVVLLCSPPGFRPLHMTTAVRSRKHIFAEKPIAVDAPGVRSVLAACEEARRQRLSVVSGLCYRYSPAKRATIARVHDGAIGDIVAIQTTYNTGTLWHHPPRRGWSDMEWQIRNWLYFTWLSGDHIVEQFVHSLDKTAWAMRDQYPVRAYGTGGRQVRTQPEFGHIYDHHSVVYEYANGVKTFATTRQQAGCANDVSDFVMGTQGVAELMGHRITGRNAWTYPRARARAEDMYQQEHNELFASIRSGNPINNGEYMCKSTLMGILGRMATYTGRVVTWEQALNSRENLSPSRMEFGPLAVAEVAMPGVTIIN
jgi:predicted dehydrogenase